MRKEKFILAIKYNHYIFKLNLHSDYCLGLKEKMLNLLILIVQDKSDLKKNQLGLF